MSEGCFGGKKSGQLGAMRLARLCVSRLSLDEPPLVQTFFLDGLKGAQINQRLRRDFGTDFFVYRYA